MAYLNERTVRLSKPGACVTIILPATGKRTHEREFVVGWSDDDDFHLLPEIHTKGRTKD